MNEQINIGTSQGNDVPAAQKVSEEVLARIKQEVLSIEKSSEDLKLASDNNDDHLQMDSHALCHAFEKYRNGGSSTDENQFSLLNDSEGLLAAKQLLEIHISDRTRSKKFWCDSRILNPIVEYNLNNLTTLNDWPFKPECLKDEAYVTMVNGIDGKKEFTTATNYSHDSFVFEFINAGTPREFFIACVRENKKFPIDDPKFLLVVIDSLGGEIDDKILKKYIKKFYFSNGVNIQSGDLIENIRSFEKAKELQPGVFVDVDGTLIINGKLNIKLAEALETVKGRVTIFSDGVSKIQSEKLRSLGFSEKFLPVVSKNNFKGMVLEKLIDDSVPAYQGFDSIYYFKIDANDTNYLSVGDNNLALDLSEVLSLDKEKIESWIEDDKINNNLPPQLRLSLRLILQKLKLFEQKK
jgi:hypothetical protein